MRMRKNSDKVVECRANQAFTSTFDEVNHAIKRKAAAKSKSDRTQRLGLVLSKVKCHVQLYQTTSNSSCKLAI